MDNLTNIKDRIRTLKTALKQFENGTNGNLSITRKHKQVTVTGQTYWAECNKHYIRETVAEGWSQGKSIDEIRDDLREKAEDFSDYQAERIARDQLQRATGDARNEFAKETDLDMVEEWLITNDNRVRDAHREMSGTWKRPNEDFIVEYPDGVALESFPGDSEKGINCRCDTLLKSRDEVSDEDHRGK